MTLKSRVKTLLRPDLSALNKQLSRKGLYEFLQILFSEIDSNETVLSIGAGGGVNRLLSKSQVSTGFRLIQIDIDESRGPDIVGDLCDPNLLIPESPFTTVVCSEVLEHCYNPFQAIENIYRNLGSNGRLILTTPFLFPLHEEPVDFFRYTRHGLEYLLRDFSKIEITESNQYGDAMLVLLARFTGFGAFGAWATTILAYLLIPFAWLINCGVKNRLGTTRYLVLATK